MKIQFDKVEVRLTGKYQGKASLMLEIPDNQKLEIGYVLQVGPEVEEIQKGDTIVFASSSMNHSSDDKYYLREREVILVEDRNEKKKYNTTRENLRVEEFSPEKSLTEAGIYLGNSYGEGSSSLTRCKVLNINPNKNNLNLKEGDLVFINPKYGLKRFQVDGTIAITEHEIVYLP